MDRIVVIMPTYNEVGNIKRMVDELFDVRFPEIKNVEMHLLIVDGNSPDGTSQVVKEKMKKYKNLHILVETEKRGLGMAYVSGMNYAVRQLRADAVIEMDGDFQHDPKHLQAMVQAYLDGADYVIGSRYIKGGSIPKEWEFHRKLVSFFGNLFARTVLWLPQLHDITTGFRLTRVKGVLDKIDLENLMELKRFAYKIDLFYQSVKNAKKVVEVPIHFASRTMEKSKFNPKEMVSSYKVVILLRLKASQKLIKFGIVGFTGFVINFVLLRVFRGMGLPEMVSWALSTEAAIVSNFTLNNIWTFSEKKISGVIQTVWKFLQFNLSSAGALVIQSVLGPIGVGLVGARYDFLVLAFVVAFVVLPYNYIMYNLFIWKTWKLPFAKK